MPRFPPPPERFIGRTTVMARASAALARESRIPGVLLHGMPGGGKTACALELAYGHEHAFERLIWYKTPDEGMDVTGALTDFALTLERYLDNFQMVHALLSGDQLAELLPRLSAMMGRSRLLIIIDNAESLLTGDGRWCDERWGEVIGALTGHTGLGRLILTTRRIPVALAGLRVEVVDALSADEALLLARELPHLHALSLGNVPGVERYVARRLARRVLDIAQGHPKPLELADGQAATPEQLAALVEAGDQAWRKLGGVPTGFFTADGKSAASGTDYLQILAAWTSSVTDALTPGARDLFWFLCCLEEPDRERPMVEMIWPHLWEELGRGGEPPDLDRTLAEVAARGLASARGEAADGHASYLVHPVIAEAGRGLAGQALPGRR